jgi:oxygen-independent coproporphyrinogen III oxidase
MADFAAITPSASSRRASRAADTAATEGGTGSAASSRLASLAAEAARDRGVSLYVHVPFCASKCAYCDFCSLPVTDERWHQAYLDGVLRETRHWRARTLDDVPTLYVGGGTPTVLGERLLELLDGVTAVVGLREDAEVTVEANPDSVTEALVAGLAERGVTRVSLGVQSFDDDVLRTLGRRHDAAAAERAAAVLRASGLRFSVDLICAVPGQSLESWRESVRRAIATGAGHVSAYPLSVEEGTPLYVQVRRGELPPPDPDTAADMMTAAAGMLAEAGLPRYEVASYARPGEESRHNVGYWTGGPYVGVGPSAASMLPAQRFVEIADEERWELPGEVPPKAARARFTRSHDVETYVYEPVAGPAEVEFLTADEAAREDVMLGLRMTSGVEAAAVEAAGVASVLARLAGDGLVETYGGRWRTTERGWLLGNVVFGEVWNSATAD